LTFENARAYSAAMITAKDIRRARKRLRESEATFAARVGVNQSTVHRWEKDGVSKQPLIQLALRTALADMAVQTSRTAE
jgi:DNA-binding transcriptional regulator YiaG